MRSERSPSPGWRGGRFAASATRIALIGLSVLPVAARGQTPAPERESARRSEEEPYHLRADRLEGSATGEENVYTAVRVNVRHGSTTVTGDSALIYRTQELVLFRGNVKIVDGTTVMRGEEASYDRRARLATLRGNVRIEEAGSRITGREARFFRTENRSVIVGSPTLMDSTRTLTADRIEYDRNKDLVTATGRVDAVDRAESTRVRAGRVRYDRRRDYAWAEDAPRLTLLEAGGESTEVRGTVIEFDNVKREVLARGSVQVEREKLRAECDRAEFYQQENRALLLGTPRAWDEEGRVAGDTLEIRFAGNRVESIQVRPNARVDYEAQAAAGRGERNHATGDTATLYLGEETARRAVIVGHAESTYWPSSADSAQGGRNVSRGDSILVEFEGGRARRATVVGRCEGRYYMEAEGDTSAASRQEVVDYRGARILYDVEHNTVDIIGSADVTYREMRLLARQVRFDSKTQRLRAEGDPVLNDRRQRITGQTMTYDLNSRRGTIYAGRTTYEKGFYYGKRIRKVSDNVLDVEHGVYTTCENEEPHYHFGSAKMKVLVRDKVIARPVIFYIKKVPVLALPFYIFPIKPGRHSGFQLPQVEFGSSTAGGKFVRNLGYYWAISDYLDATAWGDYYQQDRWVAHGQTRYHKRYHWQGQLNGSFERQFESGSRRWDLTGTHYQTLGPNFSLTARGNLTNSSDFLRDLNLGRSVLVRVQRNLRSSVSVQKSWSGAAVSAGLLRDQDLDPDRGGVRIAQQLPSVTFSLSPRPIGRPARGKDPAFLPGLASTVFGFRSVLLTDRKTFHEAVPETTVQLDTLGTPVDTTVVYRDRTETRTAARHDLSVTDVRTVFGALRISPSMSYSEVFYSRDAAGNRYQRAGVWRGSIGANTTVYGTFRPSLGPLRAIRHVVTPAIAFNYQPPYSKLAYRDAQGLLQPRFTGVSGISLAASESRFLSFSLRNDVHAKWGDPARPRVLNNVIQLQTSGSYDLLARRAGRKPLSDLASTLRLKPIQRSELDMSFLHNPYDGTLLSASATSGFTLQGKTRTEAEEEPPEEPGTAALQTQALWGPTTIRESGLPWSVNVSLSYGGSRARAVGGGYTRWASSTRAHASSAVNLSKNWRVDYTCQYDLVSRRLISQNYSVRRDLHCWEAQFTRSISGGITEYYFKINVKNLPEVYYEQGSRGLRGFGGIQNLY